MLVRSQTVIPFRSNIPRDVITNTMWFNVAAGPTLSEAAEAIALNIAAFYDEVYAPISAAGVQASYVNLIPAYTNFYNQDAPKPRVPYRVDLGLADKTTQDTVIPTEVACVLSYRAALENGVPAARRRGRIYIGGLGNAAMVTSSAGSPFFPRFASAFRDNVVAAALDNLLLPTDWGGELPGEDVVWSVYSSVDEFHAPVVAGWIDNTPDTQRRRGVNESSRTSWP